jgi:hypothetical protein
MARQSILVLVVSVLSFVGAGVWAQTRRDPTAPTTAPEHSVFEGNCLGKQGAGRRSTSHNHPLSHVLSDHAGG